MLKTTELARQRSWLPATVAAAIALKVIIIFALAWHSLFVMDEFWQLGQAKYLFDGFFDTIWPGKAVGYALFYKFALTTGWDAESVMLIGRLQTALLSCATIAIIYHCSRALGENRHKAALVVLVMLSFSNFVERIFRTISEPLALFFAAGALLAILRGNADKPIRLLVAGILLGLSFVSTQKAIYFDVALGLALICDAFFRRRFLMGVKRGLWLVGGWLTTVALYCLSLGGTDPLSVLENLLFVPAEIATRGGDAVYGDLQKYVVQTMLRNLPLYLACFAGIAVSLAKFRALNSANRVALVFSIIVTAFVFAHSEPWPYVFIFAIPFLALWSLRWFDASPVDGKMRDLASVALAAWVAMSFVSNLYYFRLDNRQQLNLVDRAERLLEPGDGYFDGIGMLPNWHESTSLWLDKRRSKLTEQEGPNSETYRALAHRPPKMIIWTYRLDGIAETVEPLIEGRYVTVSPNIRLAGARLRDGETATIDIPVAGTYTLYRPDGLNGPSSIKINGKFRPLPVSLDSGPVTISIDTGGGDFLLLPQGLGARDIRPGPDNPDLFSGRYD